MNTTLSKSNLSVSLNDTETKSGELLLSPGMSLGAAARAILAFHFDRMVANEAGTLSGDNPEALHDMRVATRRLRAALRDFQRELPERKETSRYMRNNAPSIKNSSVCTVGLNRKISAQG